MLWLGIAGALLLAWLLVNLKTSRPDGELVPGVHPYRVMLGHISPKRNEAVVYFDSYIRADKLLEYLAQAKPQLAEIVNEFVEVSVLKSRPGLRRLHKPLHHETRGYAGLLRSARDIPMMRHVASKPSSARMTAALIRHRFPKNTPT